jgi:hypothetical protein
VNNGTERRAPWRGAYDHPVERGQVWAVDHHTFACGDVIEDDLARTLVTAHRPDLTYTDPPWTDALAATFRTLGGLPPAPYPWQAIYDHALNLTPDRPQWVVTGRHDALAVATRLLSHHPHHGQWRTEGLNSPTVVAYTLYGGPDPHPPVDLTNVKDHELPHRILGAYGHPGLAFDPCSGLGLLAAAAHRLNWTTLNHELDPKRVSAALTRLSTLTHHHPVRIH